MYIDTKLEDFKLRFAEEKDVPLILQFIRELADYEEKLSHVTATEEDLRKNLFERSAAEVIIAEYQSQPAGFALFFGNFSTFQGKPGIYLEDIFVKPELRGKGFGRTMISFLARIALERDCSRLQWWCLDWNEPSIQFYKKLGAVPMEEWTVYRVCDQALERLALSFEK